MWPLASVGLAWDWFVWELAPTGVQRCLFVVRLAQEGQ